MGPPGKRSRPPGLNRQAADRFERSSDAANNRAIRRPAQLLDADGDLLPLHRSPIVGSPRLARPSWYAWTADRWAEPRP
jgi:hypothetical protein